MCVWCTIVGIDAKAPRARHTVGSVEGELVPYVSPVAMVYRAIGAILEHRGFTH